MRLAKISIGLIWIEVNQELSGLYPYDHKFGLDMNPTRVIDSRRSNHILRKGLAHYMSKAELHVFISLQTAVRGGLGFTLSECAC